MSKIKPINITSHNEKVDEVITRVPSWILRWGILTIFTTLVAIYLLLNSIKTPESINVNLKLTNGSAPVIINAKSSGTLSLSPLLESRMVRKGQLLALITSGADERQISYLDSLLNRLTKDSSTIKLPEFRDGLLSIKDVGELAKPLALFKTLFIKYHILLDGHNETELNCYSNILEALQEINRTLDERNRLLVSIQLAAKYAETIKPTINKRTKALENQKLETERLSENLTVIRTKLDTLRHLARLSSPEDRLWQSFTALNKAVASYKTKYIITATYNGKVSYLQPNHYSVSIGKPLFVLTPSKVAKLQAEGIVTKKRALKIIPKQEVLLKVTGYKFQEIGYLKAQIAAIASLNGEKVLVTVDIPIKDLPVKSKKIANSLTAGMQLSAEIVIGNKSLIDRFLGY
ncbi:hypothetical protein [Mucilaginibacter lappiensis]|uniref:hypothetical protein n=1 Tax=Mucilaginibacter lappiensis TaxID=354630 RepID=UPI003D1D8A1F